MADLNVNIKGNSAQGEAALKRTDAEMKKLGNTSKKTSSVLQNFKNNWMSITATVGIGVVAMKGAVSAAAKQEKSDVQLAKALELIGDTSQETLTDMKALGDEIQNLTTVGDEDSQMLMSLALNMGVAKDKVEEATKGSIGLAASFEKAGLSQETAMKGVALAFQGNFSQLERYIPALRDTKDETKKMAILQREMAKGFEVAKSETMTFEGAMKQMKNAVGDAQEAIGSALIPILVPLVKGIKTAAEWFQKLPGPVKIAGIAIAGALGAAIVVAKLFNTTLLANPFILIASLAITAGAFIIANWGKIKVFFKFLWEKIKMWSDIAWSGIKVGALKLVPILTDVAKWAFLPWRLQIDAIIKAANLLGAKIKFTTGELLDTAKGAAEKQLEIEKDLLNKKLELNRTAKERKREEEAKEEAIAAAKEEEEKKKLAKKDEEEKARKDGKAAEDVDREKKLQEEFQKLSKDTLGIRTAMLKAGTDAASSEKATIGSVAAEGIRALAESLSNQMKIRAIAAAASLNFAAAAGYGAAAAGIKALGGRVASSLTGGKKFEEGGIIDEPVLGIGQRTGQSYLFGEAGREKISRTDEIAGQDGGNGEGMSVTINGNLIIQPATLSDSPSAIRQTLNVRQYKRGS
jgi:hypothetical protein